MIYNSPRHRRRSIRLKGFDYAQPGAYFVTICTQDRACLFGDVVDGAVHLNGAGRLIATLWNDIPFRFSNIALDAFVVMPNHVHGILICTDDNAMAVAASAARHGATTRVAPTLGRVVGAFKSLSTVAYMENVGARGWKGFDSQLWQRNYYEHVIRDEAELSRLRSYIDLNPVRWALDDENPQCMF